MLTSLLLLVFLALVGTPLYAIIGAGALLAYQQSGIELSAVAIELYRLSEIPVLLAIPLFTLAGYLLSESRAPGRLVDLSTALLGWLPGGLALVTLAASALFTAFTGASGVTIIALGALLYPALVQAGYQQRFSLGLVTTSGSLGLLFAPSLPLILYAVLVQQLGIGGAISVDDMFRAGLLPGLLMVLVLSSWIVWLHRHHHTSRAGIAPLSALWAARWELPIPLLILGGIYGGYLAVSEAATATLIYVFIVEVMVYREIPWRELPRILREATMLVGAVLIILGVSLASTNALIDAQVPDQLFELIHEQVDHRWMFLLLLNLLLLALGMMLDIFSALVIMIPLLLPVAIGYGIDPVHLGIIFLANLQIGYFTPPVGMNLFIASLRFQQPLLLITRASWPFFVLLLACLAIITYVPQLSLLLLDGR